MGNRQTVQLEIRQDEEFWLHSWKEATDSFMADMTELDSLNESSLTAAQKFKKMQTVKEKYSLSSIPTQFMIDAFTPDVEKMKDVTMVVVEDMNAVLISSGTVEIKFKLGFNTGVYVRDKSNYEIVYNTVSKPDEKNEMILSVYRSYKEGKMARTEMVRKITDYLCERRLSLGKKPRRFKMFLDAYKNLVFSDKFITEVEEWKEKYSKDCERVSDAQKRNKERDILRKELLDSSGLWMFLKTFIDEGIEIKREGFIEEDFYPEIAKETA